MVGKEAKDIQLRKMFELFEIKQRIVRVQNITFTKTS